MSLNCERSKIDAIFLPLTEHLLKVPLTVVDQFHSHLEPMEYLSAETFRDQVSLNNIVWCPRVKQYLKPISYLNRYRSATVASPTIGTSSAWMATDRKPKIPPVSTRYTATCSRICKRAVDSRPPVAPPQTRNSNVTLCAYTTNTIRVRNGMRGVRFRERHRSYRISCHNYNRIATHNQNNNIL